MNRRYLTLLTAIMATLAAPGVLAEPMKSHSDRQVLRRTPVVEVFEVSKDSVVNISATFLVQVRSPFGQWDALIDELFNFPSRRPRTRTLESVGSGFVLHSAGYIVTNAHVVTRAAECTVIFDDQQEYQAQVVASDQRHDLAVLKIDAPKPIKPIQLGHSHDLMIGEKVIAIGNPLGYQHTVTAGIISALDRQIDVREEVVFEGLIQTDAPINPGNSGGPLLNVIGELIGITTAIRADAQNIGFAIPVDRLRELLPDMLDVERRYGILTGMRVRTTGQAQVTSLAFGSPAEKAGLQIGDLIAHMDGQPVRGPIDYHIGLLGKRAGDPIRLTLRRGGRDIQATMVLGRRPRPDGAALLKSLFGLEVKTESVGFLVTKVERGTPADRARIQSSDLIVQIGRHRPTNLDDVGELLDGVQSGQRVTLSLLRVFGKSIYQYARYVVQLTAR